MSFFIGFSGLAGAGRSCRDLLMSLLLFVHRLLVKRCWDVVHLGRWLDQDYGFFPGSICSGYVVPLVCLASIFACSHLENARKGQFSLVGLLPSSCRFLRSWVFVAGLIDPSGRYAHYTCTSGV